MENPLFLTSRVNSAAVAALVFRHARMMYQAGRALGVQSTGKGTIKEQREGLFMALFPKFSKKREGFNVVMEQRLLQSVNNLILNAETCTGCGICVEACPEEAIVLGS